MTAKKNKKWSPEITLKNGMFQKTKKKWRLRKNEMKKIHSVILGLLLINLTHITIAQESNQEEKRKYFITGAPLGILNKFRIKGEIGLTNWFSAGSQFSFYYGVYPGIQISPFCRFYLGRQAPKGFYFQPSIGFYNHTSNLDYSINGEDFKGKFTITGVGYGLGIGYQTIFGKNKHTTVDWNIGFKSYGANLDGGKSFSGLVWYTTGPGSLFSGTIQVGYAF